MAATIAQIMAGIETRLATITGLRVDDVEPYQASPPFAFVGVPAIPEYHSTMKLGRFTIRPTVTVGVSKVSDRAGQVALAGYANPTGSTSILAAIEGDRTLGGVVEDCIVVDFQPDNEITLGETTYFGGVFTLQVIASGI